jgi:RNA-binding protein NOB1
LGLGLISPEGMRIKYLRQWAKRCHACATLVPDVNRQFCPNCGKNTLMRVSVETNEKGELKCYFNPKKKINLRGTKVTTISLTF